MILIIVEGPSDRGFIEALCSKLGVRSEVKIARGNWPDKVVRVVKAYRERIDKVLVLKDEHRLSSKKLDEVANTIEAELRRLGVKGKVIRVAKSIESWILAGLCEKAVESIEKPDRKLEEKLGRPLVKSEESYAKLARQFNADHASKNSKSFLDFLNFLSSDNMHYR